MLNVSVLYKTLGPDLLLFIGKLIGSGHSVADDVGRSPSIHTTKDDRHSCIVPDGMQ